MITILAPIDFSPVSAPIVAHAAALARALHARVVLLAVMVEPVFVKEYAPTPDHLARVTVGNERAAQRRFDTFARQLGEQNVAVQSRVLQGSPRRLILEQARKLNAAYIVMGSHGHSEFYELIVGSTTQGVLKQARCPVVIIPSHVLRARPARRTTSRS